MDKYEALKKIVKHGRSEQISAIKDKLSTEIVNQGDFEFAKEIADDKNNSFNEILIQDTVDEVVKKLNYDNPKNGFDQLIKYMSMDLGYPKLKSQRDKIANNQFKLFGILDAYNKIHNSDWCIQPEHFRHIDEAKELALFHEAMVGTQVITTKDSHPFVKTPEIKQALALHKFFQVEKENEYSNLDFEKHLEILELVKMEIPFLKVNEIFRIAKNGWVHKLEEILKNKKHYSAKEQRLVEIVTPYATLKNLSQDMNESNLSSYRLRYKYEKQSDLYKAVNKFAPIFGLEHIRQNMGEGLDHNTEEWLFEISEGKNLTKDQDVDLIVDFAATVKDQYLETIMSIIDQK